MTPTQTSVISRLAILAATLSLTTALSAQAPKLGHIDFPTSGKPNAQARFIQGALYLHSFEYDSAAHAFQDAERLEPGFAMAYWGEAMTYNHPVWQQQDRDKALAALVKLGATPEARSAKAPTDREKRWLQTVEVLYGEGSKYHRDTLYARAMERLAEDYPKDTEVQAFYALSLLGMSSNGRDVALYMKAAAICEEIFRDHPDHPGAVHYLIHSYDDPVHAPLGLRAARAYSQIAPAAPHAQHMTSHIFLALGMWDETVASNVVAANMTGNTSGHYTLWLLYAYLEQGRYQEAREVLARMQKDVAANSMYSRRFHLTWARAAYLVETHEWDGEVAKLSVDTTKLDLAPFWLGLPEGWAALERGDQATAQRDLLAMQARLQSIENDTSYALGSIRVSAEIMTDELQGMLLLQQGRSDDGIAKLREAAAREDAVPYDFGPPEVIKPPKELLGEALLRLGRPAEARAAFELALARTPRRPAGLAGLAQAAGSSGDSDEAARAAAELDKVWKGPSDKRPPVIAKM